MKTLISAVVLISSLAVTDRLDAADSGLVVWSGGVSEAERASAPATGTKLVFFVKSGSYLANINVVVSTKAGQELVNTTATGPWLILNLPDGEYVVVATRPGGDKQSLTIQVDSANRREFGFSFPDS